MAKKDGVKDVKTVKKGSGVERKKVTKEDLIRQMRKHKREIQEVRFGLSKEVQKNGGSRKNLRKQLARAAMRLTKLRKNDGTRA